jgi:rRNA maturation RNase YbeY
VREQLRLNGAEITVCLVSDPAIAHMNETYRHKKGPTDVLSFPSDEQYVAIKQHAASNPVAPVCPEPRRASLPASFPSHKGNAAPKQNSLSLQVHVRAQDSCAPGPHDRSASSSRRLARTKMRATVTASSREGTASTVPNKAAKTGALAPEAHSLGDIAISPATARRNAKKFGRTLPSELQILILHGVLHLLGYDHETDNGQMTRIENRLRRKLGLQ